MAIIKAGTYKFNNVLTETLPAGEYPLNFTWSEGLNKSIYISFQEGFGYYLCFWGVDNSYPTEARPFDDSYEMYTTSIVINEDQETSDKLATWFTSNTTMLIKAGTYRWNDVPTLPTTELIQDNFNFIVPPHTFTITQEMADIFNNIIGSSPELVSYFGVAEEGTYTVNCSSSGITAKPDMFIVYRARRVSIIPDTTLLPELFENANAYTYNEGWDTPSTLFSLLGVDTPEGWDIALDYTYQIISVTEDTYVSTDFGLWATSNWQPYSKVAKKKFTRLYIGKTVATAGSKCFKRLTTEKPAEGGYLTFRSASPFTLNVYDNTKHWDGTLEYSTDTKTWNEWDGSTTLSADNGVLYLCGTGNRTIGGYNTRRWVLSGSNISCEGNIENLLDYVTVASGEHPRQESGCYSYLFYGCTSLINAPQLPATTLANNCYSHMFYGCTGLTNAPALPANVLADGCYHSMFRGCTSLKTAPQLPATTLAEYCYYYMFYGCESLIAAPELPATTLADNCYGPMFYGCTSLTTLPMLPATTLAERCYQNMFEACTNIKLSTTQTGEYQTAYRIPTNGEGTTANYALSDMFKNTGGTFTGTPSINTTYYTSNTVISNAKTITAGTYKFKDSGLTVPTWTEQAISFKTEANSYTAMYYRNNMLEYSATDYSSQVYSFGGGWIYDNVSSITIPSDANVTEKFYNWFTANAEPSDEITDLTNTTWYVPSGWSAVAEYGIFNINGTYNGTSTYSPSNSYSDNFTEMYIGYDRSGFDAIGTSDSLYFWTGTTSYRLNDAKYHGTITFTGGADASNADLITWLYDNGELQ